ncbi:MAG: hypothetical protein NUV65_05905 [Candidatus Roizmanbacteria bacterium]|nr:hypothetical protein [Candidatus Roizmanbacteria bacterium]
MDLVLGTLMITFFIVGIVFLAIRMLVLWYWRINDIVKQQEATNQMLVGICEQLNVKADRIPYEGIKSSRRYEPVQELKQINQ